MVTPNGQYFSFMASTGLKFVFDGFCVPLFQCDLAPHLVKEYLMWGFVDQYKQFLWGTFFFLKIYHHMSPLIISHNQSPEIPAFEIWQFFYDLWHILSEVIRIRSNKEITADIEKDYKSCYCTPHCFCRNPKRLLKDKY